MMEAAVAERWVKVTMRAKVSDAWVDQLRENRDPDVMDRLADAIGADLVAYCELVVEDVEPSAMVDVSSGGFHAVMPGRQP